jgi:hypothetical protein
MLVTTLNKVVTQFLVGCIAIFLVVAVAFASVPDLASVLAQTTLGQNVQQLPDVTKGFLAALLLPPLAILFGLLLDTAAGVLRGALAGWEHGDWFFSWLSRPLLLSKDFRTHRTLREAVGQSLAGRGLGLDAAATPTQAAGQVRAWSAAILLADGSPSTVNWAVSHFAAHMMATDLLLLALGGGVGLLWQVCTHWAWWCGLPLVGALVAWPVAVWLLLRYSVETYLYTNTYAMRHALLWASRSPGGLPAVASPPGEAAKPSGSPPPQPVSQPNGQTSNS